MMPPRKVPTLIASRRARAAALAQRREGLKKKARELATLCGVRVAVVCADCEGAKPPDVWESEEGVITAYRALPEAAHAAHTHRAYADAELGKEEAKLARVRQGGPAALQRWDKALDGMEHEEVQRVLGDVDATLAAVEERRRALGVPVDHGLLEGVALLRRAAPSCSGSNFVVDGYPLHAQGDRDANGARYEQAMWGNGVQQCSAASMQPSSNGFQQFPGGGADMDGYQLEMAAGMNGYSDTNAGYAQTWDAFQPHCAGVTQAGYASQCYGGMSGYHTQHAPSNGGPFRPNPPDTDPSLDIGLGYIDAPAVHNAQGHGGNFINAPSALSHAMDTADNFTNPAPAQPLAMYASGYTTQWPAKQQQFQSASSSQQFDIEQLH